MRDADAAVWLEVGLAVFHRRIELGITTQAELAALAGVHLNTVSRLERGKVLKRRSPSWSLIEAALSWPEGTIANMIDGRTGGTGPVMTADAVRQAVLEAVTRVAPDVTVRQMHQIAAETVAGLQRQGVVPPDAPG